MNTETSTPTSSAANAHEGQPAADTNQHYLFSGPPVCPYDRKQALADGLQIQLSPKYLRKIREIWGMDIPRRLFFTKKAIESLELTNRLSRRDDDGRLFHLLNLLNDAMGNSPWGWGSPPLTRVLFVIILANGKRAPRIPVSLAWSTMGVDDPRPAMTLMLQEEDRTPCDPNCPWHGQHRFSLP
jgi:hypothetical protein